MKEPEKVFTTMPIFDEFGKKYKVRITDTLITSVLCRKIQLANPILVLEEIE